MSLLDEIYEMYRDINFGNGQTCNACKEEWRAKGLSRIGPVPIYHVGEKFDGGILFIGSVGIGWKNYVGIDYSTATDGSLLDIQTRMRDDNHYLIIHDSMRHNTCKFINIFCEKFYSSLEIGFENIAITNILRCNHGEYRDNYPASILRKCANKEEGFCPTLKEIDILRPRVIIDMSTQRFRWILKSYDFSAYKQSPLLLETPFHPSKPGVSESDLRTWSEQLVEQINQHSSAIR